jgi:hypothetical protein
MLNTVAWVTLALSVLNWILFLIAAIQQLFSKVENSQVEAPSLGHTQQHSIDVGNIAERTGSLAISFQKAGIAGTAAAMSMICLLLALIASGIDKISP